MLLPALPGSGETQDGQRRSLGCCLPALPWQGRGPRGTAALLGKLCLWDQGFRGVEVLGAGCAPMSGCLGVGSDPCAGDAEVQGGIHELQLWRDPGPYLDSLKGHCGVILQRSLPPEPIASAISHLWVHFPVKLLLLCPLLPPLSSCAGPQCHGLPWAGAQPW